MASSNSINGEISACQGIVVGNYLQKYEHLMKWANHKENVLDFGCGDGFTARKILYPFIEKYVEKLTAVDICEDMIEYANANNDLEKVEFRVMDILEDENIETMRNMYDHIFSFYCLHWIEDQNSLMERFYQILKPAGQLFVICVTNSTIHEAFKMILNSETWSQYVANTTGFVDFTDNPVEHRKNLLIQNGFEIELCEVDNITSRYELKGFARFIITIHPMLQLVPQELQDTFVEEFIKNVCDCSIQITEDEYDMPKQILIFIASKKAN